MRFLPHLVAGATTLCLTLAAVQAPAQAPVFDPRQMEARLARIERSLSSSSLVQMHQTMQSLEREVRELRGEIELQRHEIGQLKQRQRDLFTDMDRRLQALESTPAARAPAGATQAGPAYPATPPVTAAPPAATPPGDAPAAPASPGATGQTRPPPAAVAAAPPAPPAAVDPAAEQQAYRAAFELLKGGQFSEASTALTKFLQDYPNGRFADNAQYWLGESYYVSREFEPALQAFQRLIQDYPDSPKHSHAMLKIGFIHDEQGRQDQAREVLTDLTQRFPQSTAAGLAAKRLKRLRQP